MRHPSRPVRRLARVVGAVVAVLALAGPVAATSPVDPNTLNPPPPDFFNATCEQTGGHILCNLAFSDPDIVDEPSGIVCGSTELLFSQQRSVVGKRFYDGDGNLTRRHFRELFDGTFTNPDTGEVATWTQHDTDRRRPHGAGRPVDGDHPPQRALHPRDGPQRRHGPQ